MATTEKTRKLIQLAILVAVMLILAFTPLGYLKIGLVEVTFMTIPVVIGAMLLGPKYGAILGAVFGATSFIQCFGMSVFGGALLAIQPVYTFILCMVPRILMGYIAGILYRDLSRLRSKRHIMPMAVASFSGAFLNTLFFVAGLILLFGSSDYIMAMRGGQNLVAFLVAFVGLNGVIEIIVALVVGTAITKALLRERKRL